MLVAVLKDCVTETKEALGVSSRRTSSAKDVTRRGEIVLDGFGGSGTTLIAAERTGRVARLVEIDPIYCDVICRRYAALTGVEPVLEATGETFEAAAETRSTEARAPAPEAAE